ncbi:kinase-like domain-containing protein [Ephemerocybe angulata]|uniref:Kinase-like domain-containing protein n=1 Tax=Ephemerocybe angulata TaxID=980116 RepID=A0A8H6M872_9AGAR|nr:kinase-like domain-containing protein [Tulosesus angulatus]
MSAYATPHPFPVDGIPREGKNFPDLTAVLQQLDPHTCAIGEHSDLFRAKRSDNEKPQHVLAVKVFRAGSNGNATFNANFQKKLILLGDTLGRLKHDNIARLYGVTYGFGRLPGVVMDFYDNSVVSYMAKCPVENDDKLKWVKQIASALKYLHRQSPPIVHGDIRGANIFIDSTSKKCLLADTSMALVTDTPEFTSMKSPATCRWAAPELMDFRQPHVEGSPDPAPSTQTDVFSFAMTAIEIFSGSPPFKQKKNDSSVIFLILNGERPELPEFVQARPYLSKVIEGCWRKDPKSRMTMSSVCWKLGLTSYLSYALERVGLF